MTASNQAFKRKKNLDSNDLEGRLQEQKRIKLQLQLTSCRKYKKRKYMCAGCYNKTDSCSFIELRAFKLEDNGQQTYGPYFPSALTPDPFQAKTHTAFNPSAPSKLSRNLIVKYLKPVLRDMLRKECDIAKSHGNPIRRNFTPGFSHACDNCMTSILDCHFICVTCAYEVCPDCFSHQRWEDCLRHPHSSDSFLIFEKYCQESKEGITMTVFQDSVTEEVAEQAKLMSQPLICAEPAHASHKMLDSAEELQDKVKGQAGAKDSMLISELSQLEQLELEKDPEYMVISSDKLTLEKFQQEWCKSKPIVVKNALTESSLEWTPEYFVKTYGDESIEVIDCASNKTHATTVSQYFKAFSCSKDWPPSDNIAEKFPDLYQDFMSIVPAPEYTTASGYFNLANRLPNELLPPDLGPKVFISYKNGKTNLHCDMADAVNILHHASESNSPAAAIWQIFPARRSGELSDWLKSRHHDFLQWWHPIHSQSLFLEDEELALLKEETGIQPWTIYQNLGDVVFVPAGCPHQVYNCRDAIKSAVDFLSPENLEMSASVTKQFSELPKADALQLKTTLLFAWRQLMEE